MADPLSMTASLLAVIIAAVKSTKSLYETVRRYQDRSKTLRRLLNELEDLAKILDSLTQVTNAQQQMLLLLQGPIERCAQVCRDFEKSMEGFSGKSKTGFRDWAKMEFMKGDINEFIDSIAGYKSTISVALGTINLQNSKVSQQVLEQFNEVIQDTEYNLELHLQRIDQKIAQLTTDNTNASGISIDLKDERKVTEQCLRICEDASSYIISLSVRASPLLKETPQDTVGDAPFDGQLRTREVLDKNLSNFAETIGLLQKRLESLVLNEEPGTEHERLKLEADLETSKQCLDVCKVASEISRQKVFRIGEVIADGNSDQVVVTDLADLFDIKKAISNDNSAQLVGSLTPDSLRDAIRERYSSRFAAVAGDFRPAEAGATSSTSVASAQKRQQAVPPQSGDHELFPGRRTKQDKPSPNEVRKRHMGGATD